MSDTTTQTATEYMERAEYVQGGDILIGRSGGELTIDYTDARYNDDGDTTWTAETDFGTIDLGYTGDKVLIKRPLPN